MRQTVKDDFLKSFDCGWYPEAFLQAYETMECLSYNQSCETLIVKDRSTGDSFIAKCYTDLSMLSHTTESELLKKLDHSGLPAFIAEFRNDVMLCVVREYVKGIPLNKLAQGKPLDEQQVITIGIQLCDILTYLHGRTPPVIHRDIKPQNIIIKDDGQIKLIDFGISRMFNENANTDTVFFGTQEFAPPEQYGFSQTDGRADIFSLGVLLCWLLTGETRLENACDKITNRRLKRTIRKCVSFAPKDRYKDAKSVKHALANADGHVDKRIKRAGCMAAALLLSAMLGFAAGRFTDIGLPAADAYETVVFDEPLIEQAVRLQLGKSETDIISAEELLSVTKLYVFGNRAAADEASYLTYADEYVQERGFVTRGSISSLSDIAKLKNLRKLSLSYQNISDLKPLRELAYLENAELKHNPIQDVSPLSQLKSLSVLVIFDTNVSDLTSLRGCTRLSVVDAGGTQIRSMTALEGLDSLKTLVLDKTQLKTLDNIGTHTLLEQLSIKEAPVLELTPLLDLPRLQTVYISNDMLDASNSVSDTVKFKIMCN